MIDPKNIEQVISALENQADLLDGNIVQTSLAALRAQLKHTSPVAKDNLHGERKQVTVMFADISGFTAMSEKLDPEEVRSLINLCFERLGEVVERYDGYIDKFIGDEIMALFGAPVTHENDPERALRTALDMMKALEEFNQEYAAKIPKPLALHFGINSGLVIAGGIGTRKRQDYSVMGDTVNLASRLEGLSESGEILVGEDTYRLTAPLFDFDKLPPVTVKGKEHPVQVYRLLRAKAIQGGQIRGIEGLFSPLVGRVTEFDQLQALQRQLAEGKGAVISVIGEAGLGKSRLVSELNRICHLEEVADWAEGRALSHAENASYLIVRHVLRSLLKTDTESSPDEVDRALRAEVEHLFPEQNDEVYPYLASLLELPLNEKAIQRVKYLEGEALRQRIWQAGKTFIMTKTQQAPLVLVWDDLHWSDPSSLEVLEALLPLTQQCRVLMIMMYRPRRDSRIWGFYERAGEIMGENHFCIELPPLSNSESQQLLKNLLGVCTLPEEIEQLILNKAEGNPFYLEEVIRALLNSGALILSDDAQDCMATAEVKDIAIPDTLQGVIMSRIDRLDPAIKRTLQIAAVMGRNFTYKVLKDIVGTTIPLTIHLQSLERQDLISHKTESVELEYAFKHVFTQESVYQSLLRSDRQTLHQSVGQAIEARFVQQLDDQALLLAYHFEKGEDVENALKYLNIAANHALKTYANHEARELYNRILTLLDKDDYAERWNILQDREQVLDRLGQRDQQATDLTLLQTLAELLEDDERLAITHNRRAAYFDKISEYQAADEAAAAGLRVAKRGGNAHLEAVSLNSLALAAWRRFDYRQVQQWAGQALEALKIIGDPPNRITSLLHLGRASYRLGQYDTALEYIQAAQMVANNTDNRESDALAELILGWIYQRLGSYDKSAEHYGLMLEKRRQIGDRYGEATALSHLGWLAADQKLYADGLDYCQQALEISQAINDRENEAYALSGLALNQEYMQNYDQAKAHYTAALTLHRAIGATTIAIFDQAGLARIALQQQDVETAHQHITKVTDWILAGNAQQFWDPWIIYLSAYQVLTALDETETAQTIVNEAHAILHQRAEEIGNESLRDCFLQEVEVNRQIDEAWQGVQATV